MLQTAAAQSDTSLLMIEGCLTAISVAAAFAWPRLGATWYSRIEHAFLRLAQRRRLAVATVGFSTLVLRLALLPLFPIPLPFGPDDFSFLLAADTFAHGRLTNPTPPMWTHFESIHISMQPTYMSMYFPAQGLFLAAGKVLFGHPWFGLLVANALMCAAICWMLQAWLPPAWALLGGMLAMLRLGLFSYWINTYTGAGAITALGAALVLGALPRLIKTARVRYGLLLATGIVLLALTRPYEGLLLCLPVAIALGNWVYFGKHRPNPALLVRRAVFPLVLIVAAVAWLGYYDYRAFGGATTLPYTVNRATYATAPYFIWQSKRAAPVYRHELLQRFYVDFESKEVPKIQSVPGFIHESIIKLIWGILFFAGIALLPPLIMIRRVFLDHRLRFLIFCVIVLTAGLSIEIFLVPHYLAPFAPAFYAIGLQAMRHLWHWKPAGATLVRLTVTLCFVLAGVRAFATQLKVPEWPPSEWALRWYGPDHFGTERAVIKANLEQLPGNQLVLVRYSPQHYLLDEWVYNAADIDSSKVVWAREMDAVHNLELFHYYPDRKVWLVQPDARPPAVFPYPMPLTTPASH